MKIAYRWLLGLAIFPAGVMAQGLTSIATNQFRSDLLAIDVDVQGARVLTFEITVTPTKPDPLDKIFPDHPRAWLRIQTNGTTVLRCELSHTKRGKAEVYGFDIRSNLVEHATFTFSYHTPATGRFLTHHFSVLLGRCPLGRAAPARDLDTATRMLSLRAGTQGASIIKRFGKPTWWGKLDRKPRSGNYTMDNSIMDGGAGTLGHRLSNTGRMSWVYPRAGKDIAEKESCIIMMLTSNKLDRVIQGSISGFDNS